MDNDLRRHAPYTHFISNFGMLITAIPNYIDDCIKYFTIKICEYCKRLKNSEIWSHRLYTLGYLMKIYKNNERKKVGQALRMDRSYRICVKITTLLSLIFFFFCNHSHFFSLIDQQNDRSTVTKFQQNGGKITREIPYWKITSFFNIPTADYV